MGARPSILLIDDEEVSVRLHAKALERRGFDVIFTTSGEEGLILARHHSPRLIISDIQMPTMSGFEFCEALIRRQSKASPVIFLTGYDHVEALREGLQAGGDDFLSKGAPMDEIMDRIRFWMASGFRELPQEARKKALTMLKDWPDEQQVKIKDVMKIERDVLINVAKQARLEADKVSDHYGERLIERIFFLGRLSHLVLETCDTVGRAVRFPEYLLSSMSHLDYPWIPDLNILFGRFDTLARDPRFHEAAKTGLIEIKG